MNLATSRHPPIRSTAALACLAFIGVAHAQEASSPRSLWEIGGVAVGAWQQAYPGSDQQVRRGIALPFLVYRGRFLRADNEGVGVRPVRTPRYEFDISAAFAFGSDADQDPARRGMPNLGTLVEFGPRLKWHLGGTPQGGRWRLDLPLRGVFDLSDSLEYRGAVFQPGIVWSQRPAPGWSVATSLSAVISDQRLARTFYEVAPQFATPTRPAYQADGGLLAWRLGASISRDFGRDWTVFAFGRIDTVAGAANRSSPLVRQTTGSTVGIGVSYTWLRSSEPAVD
ncbi:MipA/OmpV family protein [Ramlibacter henchirensis]|nr:MipA/OmpV family protein [Ramlibacter henchirensis]